jgi:hypothetical protein
MRLYLLSVFVTGEYAVEIQKENEIIKWSVREYAYVIRQ